MKNYLNKIGAAVLLMSLFIANEGKAQENNDPVRTNKDLLRKHDDLMGKNNGVAITNSAFIQDHNNQTQDRVNFALKAGYAVFTLRGAGLSAISPAGKPRQLSGYHFGAEVNTGFSSHFSLKHEIAVVQEGAFVKMQDNEEKAFDSKFRSVYLNIAPLSPTFKWGGLQVFGGPYLGLLLQASIQRKDELGKLYTDKRIFGDPNQEGGYAQKMDAGLFGGLGYEFKNGLTISGRYLHGMTAVLEHTENTGGQEKIFNRGFSVSLGYSFIGRR